MCAEGETGLVATSRRLRFRRVGERSGGENRSSSAHASYSTKSSTSYSTGCATFGVAGMIDRPASLGDLGGGLGLAMYDYPHPT
jgi:hypothetical protein